jgi:hypothetical protein
VSRRDHHFVLWTFAVLSALVAGLLLFASMRNVVLRFMHDDAFYYFGIAWRWNRSGFPTFDGINATNGYHPLWQWLLVPSAGLFQSPETFARAFAAVGVVFFFAATLLVVRKLTREENAFAPLAYAWVGGALLLSTLYGLESPLAALLLAVCIVATPTRPLEWRWTRVLVSAAASVLLFLARIDALAWILAFDTAVVVLVSRTQTRRMVRGVVAILILQLVAIGGYFIANWITSSHWLTVSATLKASRAPVFSLAVPPSLLFLLAVGVTALGLVPLAEFARAAYRRSATVMWALITAAWLALGNLVYLALIAVKGDHETYNWYFTLSVFSGAYLIPLCVNRYGRQWAGASQRVAASACLAVCLLPLAVSVRSKVAGPSFIVAAYDQALVLSSYPEGSLVLGATDCGVLGYFSHQHVINLDGLTNSWAFLDAVEHHQVAAWLRTRGLNAYVSPPAPAGSVASLHVRPGLFAPAETLSVRVEPMMPTAATLGRIGIWRITGIEGDAAGSE